jgi:hypothetical protein
MTANEHIIDLNKLFRNNGGSSDRHALERSVMWAVENAPHHMHVVITGNALPGLDLKVGIFLMDRGYQNVTYRPAHGTGPEEQLIVDGKVMF